jgi:uncharacterized protein involved in exopolysaccharide biosynthesis
MYEVAPHAEPTAAPPPRLGYPVEPWRLWLAVRASSRALAGSALVALVLSALVARFAIARTWIADATLTWEPLEGPVDPTSESLAIETIVESAELPTILARIRAELAIPSTLPEIAARIDVSHGEGTRLVQLRANGSSREEAELLGVTACRALLAHRTELATERLSDALERTERSLAAAERTRDEARRTYDAFREEHGIADLEADMELAIAAAADLRTRALVARSDAEAVAAELTSLRAQERVSRTSVPLSETTRDPGAEQLGETRTSLSAARGHLTRDHPRIQALSEQERALDARPETALVASRTFGQNPEWVALREGVATRTAARAASRLREESLSGLASSERARVDRLTAVEGRAAELLAIVELADTTVNALRAEASTLRAQLEAVAPDLRVVAPATAPEHPVGSPRRAVTVGGLVAGLVLALAVTLSRALWGLRVHTAAEAAFWSGTPTVASSGWPTPPHRVTDLVADLVRILPPRALSIVVVAEGRVADAVQLARALRRSRLADPSCGSTIRALRSADASPAGRRAVRAADVVLVTVASGHVSGLRLLDLRARLGRDDCIGLVVCGLGPALANVADRAGRLELSRPHAVRPVVAAPDVDPEHEEEVP